MIPILKNKTKKKRKFTFALKSKNFHENHLNTIYAHLLAVVTAGVKAKCFSSEGVLSALQLHFSTHRD